MGANIGSMASGIDSYLTKVRMLDYKTCGNAGREALGDSSGSFSFSLARVIDRRR
jgi:hypothetical protein